jgi:hypothetical protein
LLTVFKIILFKQKPIDFAVVPIIRINGLATGIAWFGKVHYSEMEIYKPARDIFSSENILKSSCQ